MNPKLRYALILDGMGTLLFAISVLSYVGIPLHPWLEQPAGYLACGGIGLLLATLGTLSLVRNLRSPT